ncbi:MAG: PilZ domain-containing protein [Magnetococcales bacterium]|nr:PilZ domain-containing protein [Magnetococcales bacterium]
MAAQSTPPQGNQQREFVRIDDLLPFSWKKVSPEEAQEVLTHFEKHREFPNRTGDVNALLSSMDVSDHLKRLARNDATLAQVLSRLDMKLNLLIRLFHPGEQQQPMVPTPINLSGGGLAFWEAEVDTEIGDLLHVRLALTQDALASIECYARVVHIRQDDQDGMDKVACNFEPILAPDREQIVQHIFKRQAERLRAQKKL